MTASKAEVAVNPRSGEVLEHLDQQPPEALADAFAEILARQSEMTLWSAALEAELRRRLRLRGRKSATFGDWEVRATTTKSSEWDANHLEQVMQELVDDGTVKAGELTGIIKRDPEVVRSKAKRFRDGLTGEARAAVDATFSWAEKRGKLTVTRSQPLIPEGDPDPAEDDEAFLTHSAPQPTLDPPAEDGQPTTPEPTTPEPTLDAMELFS